MHLNHKAYLIKKSSKLLSSSIAFHGGIIFSSFGEVGDAFETCHCGDNNVPSSL